MADPADTRFDLPKDNRAALAETLGAAFPAALARDDQVSPMEGGQNAARARLEAVNPPVYGRTRNHLDGDVSRLSPYIRHGALALAEVRDHAISGDGGEKSAWKFVNELGWRDFWQRVYRKTGDGVWEDREAYKTGWDAEDYGDTLPPMVEEGRTGLACMDGFARDLTETGYLHNHARMWMAAYVVHFLRIKWQAGARWFLTHLLDGDPASNNLSWQWVASTFSGRPYFFNRENLEKYTDGRYCAGCPKAGSCPFDASYEELGARLFPHQGERT